MWSCGCPHNVVTFITCTYPILERSCNSVFENPRSMLDCDDLCSEHLHPEHIGALTVVVDFAHINRTSKSHLSSHSSGCETMLTGTSFSDDPLFSHSLGDQGMPETMIDLMRASMQESFVFEKYLSSSELLAEIFRMIKWRGPTSILTIQIAKLLLKNRVFPRFKIGFLDALKLWNEHLRSVSASVFSEESFVVSVVGCREEKRIYHIISNEEGDKRIAGRVISFSISSKSALLLILNRCVTSG